MPILQHIYVYILDLLQFFPLVIPWENVWNTDTSYALLFGGSRHSKRVCNCILFDFWVCQIIGWKTVSFTGGQSH